MEPIGTGGKHFTEVSGDWTSRLSTTKEKESVRIAAEKRPKSQEIPNRVEFSNNNQDAVKALADRMMAFLDANRYSLQFIPNQENGRVTIRVLNNAGKVIRQIPPEESDRLLLQTGPITGLLVNERLE
jgi:uncharacterized FlaG/YvyC family protein